MFSKLIIIVFDKMPIIFQQAWILMELNNIFLRVTHRFFVPKLYLYCVEKFKAKYLLSRYEENANTWIRKTIEMDYLYNFVFEPLIYFAI